jgi:hypothetical protein
MLTSSTKRSKVCEVKSHYQNPYYRSSHLLTRGTGRIHLSLQYDAPDLAARKSIWQNFAKATSNSRLTMDLSEADLDTLAAIPLNGRQVSIARIPCFLGIYCGSF